MPDAPEANLGGAAAAAAASAPPAAPPAPEPESAIPDQLPDGDTFDRPYVQKLRDEAAGHRVARREFESHFEGYSDEARAEFLGLAGLTTSDPKAAAERFRTIADRLAPQETPVLDGPPNPNTPQPPEKAFEATPEAVAKLVEEGVAAALAERDRGQAVQDVFAQAAAIDPQRYAQGSSDLVALIHEAQHNPEAKGTIEGAHAVLEARRQAEAEAAVAAYRESLAPGAGQAPAAAHPPRVPSGSATPAAKPEPITDFAAARRAAEERMGAAWGN